MAVVPSTWRGYVELTRVHRFPIGHIFSIWPAIWGITMAAYTSKLPVNDLVVRLVSFAVGMTILHGAACVINDICDIEFDRQCECTKTRPLASGRIPVYGAWMLCASLVAICFLLLSFMNSTASFIGIFGIFPFHGLYPMMKRWTWWPQAWLGIALGWGFVVSWLSLRPVAHTVDLKIMGSILASVICWTIVNDTEYACQDLKDDAKAGVKSTALLFGDYVREILMVFAAGLVLALVAAGVYNQQTAAYYVVTCGGTALHLMWQLLTWKVDDPADCSAKFKSNANLGYIAWAGMLLDYVLRTTKVTSTFS